MVAKVNLKNKQNQKFNEAGFETRHVETTKNITANKAQQELLKELLEYAIASGNSVVRKVEINREKYVAACELYSQIISVR